jgi:hypothetical protein
VSHKSSSISYQFTKFLMFSCDFGFKFMDFFSECLNLEMEFFIRTSISRSNTHGKVNKYIVGWSEKVIVPRS